MLPVMSVFAIPYWSGIADRTDKKKTLGILAASQACVFCLYAVPSLLDVLTEKTWIKFVGNATLAKWIWCMIIQCVHSFFLSPILPILDALAIDVLESSGRSSKAFGTQRLWGAISWAIVNLVLGFATDHASMGVEVMYGGMLLTTVLFCSSIYFHGHVNLDDTHNEVTGDAQGEKGVAPKDSSIDLASPAAAIDKREGEESTTLASEASDLGEEVSRSSCNQLSILLAQLHVIWKMLTGSSLSRAARLQSGVFFAVAFVLGAVTSLLEAYEFLFFVQDLDASALMCGVSVVITVMFEIPIFCFGQQLLERCGSAMLIVVAQVAYIVRVWGYTMLTPKTVWLALPLESLHGVTYGCFTTAAVECMVRLAPEGLEASAQGALSLVRSSVGTLLGSVVGGIVFRHVGAVTLFRGAGAIVLLALVPFAIVFRRELVTADARALGEDGESTRARSACCVCWQHRQCCTRYIGQYTRVTVE